MAQGTASTGEALPTLYQAEWCPFSSAESCEGRGCGSRLAAAALEDARREGLDVVPLCPFIARYIERHPEYEQLVAPGYRDH